MNAYRRFLRFSSTKLGNSNHSFDLLDRLAKSASSHNNEKLRDYLQERSGKVSIDPLNAVLARWENEFLESPNEILNPKKVLEKVDGWKELVDSIGNTNSLEIHLQQQVKELLRPDMKSYMHVIQAVASSIDQRSQKKKHENQNKLNFIDALLKRLVEESKLDLSMQPNVASFAAVMNAWAKTNGVNYEGKRNSSSSKKVEELLLCMEKLHEEGWHNVQPNVVIYNILLSAWAKEGEVKKIEDTLQKMIRLEIPWVCPDSVSYSTLLSAYAKLGTPEATLKADSLLHQMLELYNHGMESAKPNVISFSNVIQCHANLGNGDEAEEWLRRLQDLYRVHKDSDWKPDVAIFNAVVQAWVKSGEPQKAEDFLRYMMVMDKENVDSDDKSENYLDHFVQPNSRSFNAVLSAWAKIGEAERAEVMLMEMHNLHVEEKYDTRPTVVSYNTVLDSYAQKTIKIMNAKKKKNGLKNRHKRKDNCKWTSDQGEDAPWNRAEAILNHMIELYRNGDLSVKPTARTWNTGKFSLEF